MGRQVGLDNIVTLYSAVKWIINTKCLLLGPKKISWSNRDANFDWVEHNDVILENDIDSGLEEEEKKISNIQYDEIKEDA